MNEAGNEVDLARTWKDSDSPADATHPAGDIRLAVRRFGVKAALLAGMTVGPVSALGVGVALVTIAVDPGTTGHTTVG